MKFSFQHVMTNGQVQFELSFERGIPHLTVGNSDKVELTPAVIARLRGLLELATEIPYLTRPDVTRYEFNKVVNVLNGQHIQMNYAELTWCLRDEEDRILDFGFLIKQEV